jgi:hypothetical protein
VPLELSRLQWEEGSRRVEEARGDARRYRRLQGQVAIVNAELRRRVGQTFTLDELDSAYARADDWTRLVLAEAGPEGPAPEAALVADAAFHAFARGASDYDP